MIDEIRREMDKGGRERASAWETRKEETSERMRARRARERVCERERVEEEASYVSDNERAGAAAAVAAAADRRHVASLVRE